ncbi:uncharacterized protein LOC119721326 [Patiria miniata]|uniref:ISXO2-like transposase domain-containing protein n=1 Tax=Patiria miniata TaxID=46514 RepID=A0A913Z8U1_PATMI|nr:uncharacterized protein LOC119721326 [Patiria miniata]
MSKFVRKCNVGIQHGCSPSTQSKGTQVEKPSSSYHGKSDDNRDAFLTYDRLCREVLCSQDAIISWCQDIGLIAKAMPCPTCGECMAIVETNDRADHMKWECRRQIGRKRHRCEKSIRSGSWFAQSNLSLEETLKFTYWWCCDLKQDQIRQQLQLGKHTAVDWDMFCRETCEVVMMQADKKKVGGEGKRVQIDESKIGKRKYYRGHQVEGQWVFGGIEEDSRECFIVTVEHRDEATLLPLIQEWIAPGTTIISDCWKAYINLPKYGYTHETVNHSKEFVNKDGSHTNKIEGHWRQMKTNLSTHGRRKHHYASYLAEFLYRYKHKDSDIFKAFIHDVVKVYNPH